MVAHTYARTHTCSHAIANTHTRTYLVKLARFCVTLAMRVRVRAVRSSGYSCIRLKSDGAMTAGHRKRRNREALIRRSLMSGRPRLLHSCLHEANTSFSSRGKTLVEKEILPLNKIPSFHECSTTMLFLT